MFTRLLLPLDGSPASQVALAQAILLGRRFRSALTLAYVSRPADDDPLFQRLGYPWMERAQSNRGSSPYDGVQQLLADARDMAERAGLPVEVVQRRGDPVEELRTLAEAVDLVVVGSQRGLGGADPLTPEVRELAQRAPRPVLICGASPSAMDRCAVAYDGAWAGDQALELAARYAGITDAQLEVIHLSDDEKAGRAVLARASGALSASPLRFEIHLEPGHEDGSLIARIRRLGCNAVVAGAAREDGRWLVPRHTEAILRATDLPVLIHHQPQGALGRVSAPHRHPAPR